MWNLALAEGVRMGSSSTMTTAQTEPGARNIEPDRHHHGFVDASW